MTDDSSPLPFIQPTPFIAAPPTGDPKPQPAPRVPQPPVYESRTSLVCTRAKSCMHILASPTTTTPSSPGLYAGKVNVAPDAQNDLSAAGALRHHSHDAVSDDAHFDQYPDLIFKSTAADKTNEPNDLDTPVSEDTPERPGRVRFRSRVRITSGLNRHRHKSYSEQNSSYVSFSRSSSLSGSPSSSISAPLRNQAEDEIGKPGWGTLGTRVSILAQGNLQRKRQREQREQAQAEALLAENVQLGISLPPGMQQYTIHERTPLISSSSPYLYLRRNGQVDNASEETTDEEAERLSNDVDIVFGPWPARLWNHHWWWWQMEPILCCRCLTELDSEG